MGLVVGYVAATVVWCLWLDYRITKLEQAIRHLNGRIKSVYSEEEAFHVDRWPMEPGEYLERGQR